MDMEISSLVVSVGVGTDKCLMTSEILTAELLPHLMDFLKREIVVIPVSWVKRNYVMVALYIALVLILPIPQICLDALHGVSIRGAVDAGNDVFLTRDVVTMLIKNGTLSVLVMLVFQI
ncbi:MAG: hypothetical protein MJ077_03220 [Oscillospiraceae bacterium]|nr:hypothetical protein [Oscillospiraceae bacterium]